MLKLVVIILNIERNKHIYLSLITYTLLCIV